MMSSSNLTGSGLPRTLPKGAKGSAILNGKHPESVKRRNARERKRVQQVNSAFLKLRDHVPRGGKGKKLSKVETLRNAVYYIQYLQETLDGGSGPGHRGPSPHSEAAAAIHAALTSAAAAQQGLQNPECSHESEGIYSSNFLTSALTPGQSWGTPAHQAASSFLPTGGYQLPQTPEMMISQPPPPSLPHYNYNNDFASNGAYSQTPQFWPPVQSQQQCALIIGGKFSSPSCCSGEPSPDSSGNNASGHSVDISGQFMESSTGSTYGHGNFSENAAFNSSNAFKPEPVSPDVSNFCQLSLPRFM